MIDILVRDANYQCLYNTVVSEEYLYRNTFIKMLDILTFSCVIIHLTISENWQAARYTYVNYVCLLPFYNFSSKISFVLLPKIIVHLMTKNSIFFKIGCNIEHENNEPIATTIQTLLNDLKYSMFMSTPGKLHRETNQCFFRQRRSSLFPLRLPLATRSTFFSLKEKQWTINYFGKFLDRSSQVD